MSRSGLSQNIKRRLENQHNGMRGIHLFGGTEYEHRRNRIFYGGFSLMATSHGSQVPWGLALRGEGGKGNNALNGSPQGPASVQKDYDKLYGSYK